MPKVFVVHLSKETSVTYNIVAESEKELQEALSKHIDDGDIDDWVDPEDPWTFNIVDPLKGATTVEKFEKVSSTLGSYRLDMGVEGGECLDLYDYKLKHPDYRDKMEEENMVKRRKLHLERDQIKLF